MSKALLVIEMPDSCSNCSLGSSDDGEEVYCNILGCTTYQSGLYEDDEEEELYNSKKPDWCPLKPMPERKKAKMDDWNSETYVSGWNNCIDAIEGNDKE